MSLKKIPHRFRILAWVPTLLLFFLFIFFHLENSYAQEPEKRTSGKALAYVAPIEGEIFKGLVRPVERGIDEAAAAGAEVIIIELKTPGGAVDTALKLKDLIIDASKEQNILTVAYINRQAISAGALMALSCNKIYVREGSTIGGAAPIMSTGQEMGETTEQKFTAVVAAEFRAAAKANGHDPELAEAMVDKDFEIPGIIEEGKLLSLDAENALNLGLAVGMVESVEGIMEDLGYEDYSIYRVQQNWAETVARFITNPAVAGILLMLAIGGLYLEVRTPGFGIPGMVGITAFILAFWGHHIAGLAGLEVVLFFLLGVILLGVELFITPGFGVMGASGLVLIMASMLFMLSERMPVMDRYFTLEDLVRPMLILGSSIAGAAVLSTALLAFLPTTSMFQHLVLSDSTSREEGFSGTEKIEPELMGREGVTTSELRPAGIARFGNKRLDVVTDGSYIEVGRPVKIVKVVGRRIVVKEIRG